MLRIYNTMIGSKEPFEQQGDAVHMYVCGVTVYDYCHIGHARSAVAFDSARRAMTWMGMNVVFVKNFTDIDDKIIRKANETGEGWKAITKKYIDAHNEDMAAINVVPPTYTPLATEYIGDMVNFCERLIASGHAYESGGDVYYRVASFKEYGKLSKRNLDDLLAGARVDVNEQKENPLDFALWKAAKPGEPSWPSPWGEGRPGWHIECSVMSEKLLGVPIDIHGGGQDLIFPHHENEIAQSEAACGCLFTRVWMHNGFVNINKEKMSKSLGNFFTIREILNLVDGEVLRFFLLTTHYRQPLEYADVKLFDAENSLGRIYIYKDELAHAVASAKGGDTKAEADTAAEAFNKAFRAALEDDFNTPAALAAVFDFVRAGNTILSKKINTDSLEYLRNISYKVFSDIDSVLGVAGRAPEEWFAANLNMAEDEVLAAIAARNDARKNKDFATADAIRQSLAANGVELIDTLTGTRYRAVRRRQEDAVID